MNRAMRQVNDARRSGGQPPPNARQRRQLMRRLWQYLGRYKLLLLLALAMTIGGNLLGLMGPSLSGKAVNAMHLGTGRVDLPAVLGYVGQMIAFYAASGVVSYLQSLLMIKLSRNVVYQMRKDVFDHLTTLPVSFFDRHQVGDIISTISYDIDTINASLSNDTVQILTSVVTVLGSLYFMITTSAPLVLVFVVTLPISIVMTQYRSKRVRPRYRLRSGKLGRMNGFVEEAVGAQKTVKAYHREAHMLGRFDERNDDAVEAYYQADYYGSIMGPTVNFINNLSLTLISVFGSLLYMAGGILVGDITAFVQYSRKFAGPINEFANIVSDLQSAFAAAERVFGVLDEPAEPADPE
ncbi:MAG: ABC transporter ATP-binding protein, partial [Clostridiales bacterium]|nr:ABC transporter ATP-binding protein [Clostridiales bacterium]